MHIYTPIKKKREYTFRYLRSYKEGVSHFNYISRERCGSGVLIKGDKYNKVIIEEGKIKCEALLYPNGIISIVKFVCPATSIIMMYYGPYIFEDQNGKYFKLKDHEITVMDRISCDYNIPIHPYPVFFLRNVLTSRIFSHDLPSLLINPLNNSEVKARESVLNTMRFIIGLTKVKRIIDLNRVRKRLLEFVFYQPRNNRSLFINRVIKEFRLDLKVPMECDWCSKKTYTCDSCEYSGCIIDQDTRDDCYWGEFISTTFFCYKCLSDVKRD